MSVNRLQAYLHWKKMIGERKTRPNATKKKQSLFISAEILNAFNEGGKALNDQLLKAQA